MSTLKFYYNFFSGFYPTIHKFFKFLLNYLELSICILTELNCLSTEPNPLLTASLNWLFNNSRINKGNQFIYPVSKWSFMYIKGVEASKRALGSYDDEKLWHDKEYGRSFFLIFFFFPPFETLDKSQASICFSSAKFYLSFHNFSSALSLKHTS